MGKDAGGERGAGGGFKGERGGRVVAAQPELLGPVGVAGEGGVGVGVEVSVAGREAVNLGGVVEPEQGFDGLEYGPAEGGGVRVMDFVEVEAGAFPVFVKGNGGVVVAVMLGEPCFVGARLGRGGVVVVAVEVNAIGGFAGAGCGAAGVEQGVDVPGDLEVKPSVFHEFAQGEGAGGLVAVDAGGEVEAEKGLGRRVFGDEQRDAVGRGPVINDAEPGGVRGGDELAVILGGVNAHGAGPCRGAGGGAKFFFLHAREKSPVRCVGVVFAFHWQGGISILGACFFNRIDASRRF